jgi:hypothetical protein
MECGDLSPTFMAVTCLRREVSIWAIRIAATEAAYQSADESAHSKELRAPLCNSPNPLYAFRQAIQ